MVINLKQYKITFLIIGCFILFISIFKWIEYLTKNKYIVECFTSGNNANTNNANSNNQMNTSSTSHSVDLPLNSTSSCSNFCGPTARCSVTGQQCFADIDCPGCQPSKSSQKTTDGNCVPGNDDAGKLTVGVTPNYSSLTSGYGTREKIITSNMYSKPAMPNFGVNDWQDEFNEEESLFDKRYKPPSGLQFMSNYPVRYSLTGQFIDDGPYASNAPLK